MSRSNRKIPILPNCKASSEKREKQNVNRRLRRMVKEKLALADQDLPQKMKFTIAGIGEKMVNLTELI